MHVVSSSDICLSVTSSPEHSRPKVYWISLDVPGSVARRNLMQSQLGTLGLPNQRIEAIFPSSPKFNITKLVKPCKRNTEKDLAVILSHLTAIYTAVHDEISTLPGSSLSSEYALITEDDVQFQFDVDYDKLVKSVPDKDFGILQLITSNIEGINRLWNIFSSGDGLWSNNTWDTLTKDRKAVLFWSAQAYIINKRIVRPFIEDVVSKWYNETSQSWELSFQIIDSFDRNGCKRTKKYPCILANCLFSDSYIYAGGGPTYILNFPLFNGHAVGLNSSLHQEQVEVDGGHKDAFAAIQKIIDQMKSNTYDSKLPNFIKIPECHQSENNVIPENQQYHRRHPHGHGGKLRLHHHGKVPPHAATKYLDLK